MRQRRIYIAGAEAYIQPDRAGPHTMHEKARDRALLWLPLALFVGIVGFQILGPVPVGLADNRDFARVLGPLRLWPVPPFKDDPHLFFDYFVNDYVVRDPIYDLGIPSSESLLAAAAKEIATIVLPAGTFKLSLIGLLHAAFYFLALFIVLSALRKRAPWVRLICGLLLVFIWTDRVTVWQFNTAYTDAGALAALVVLFAIAVRYLLVGGGWPSGLAFAVFGCFLLGTKTQHLTALPFLIAFCLLAGFRIRRKRDRAVWLTAPVFLLGTAYWMFGSTADDYRTAPAFTVVFHKLTVLAPDAKTVLAHFHMPEEEFLKYVGQFAYQPGVPMNDPAFRHRIVRLVTPSSLASFYWRHPGITTKVLLFDLRTIGAGYRLSPLGLRTSAGNGRQER